MKSVTLVAPHMAPVWILGQLCPGSQDSFKKVQAVCNVLTAMKLRPDHAQDVAAWVKARVKELKSMTGLYQALMVEWLTATAEQVLENNAEATTSENPRTDPCT